jgi:hypothetical protein
MGTLGEDPGNDIELALAVAFIHPDGRGGIDGKEGVGLASGGSDGVEVAAIVTIGNDLIESGQLLGQADDIPRTATVFGPALTGVRGSGLARASAPTMN